MWSGWRENGLRNAPVRPVYVFYACLRLHTNIAADPNTRMSVIYGKDNGKGKTWKTRKGETKINQCGNTTRRELIKMIM